MIIKNAQMMDNFIQKYFGIEFSYKWEISKEKKECNKGFYKFKPLFSIFTKWIFLKIIAYINYL